MLEVIEEQGQGHLLGHGQCPGFLGLFADAVGHAARNREDALGRAVIDEGRRRGHLAAIHLPGIDGAGGTVYDLGGKVHRLGLHRLEGRVGGREVHLQRQVDDVDGPGPGGRQTVNVDPIVGEGVRADFSFREGFGEGQSVADLGAVQGPGMDRGLVSAHHGHGHLEGCAHDGLHDRILDRIGNHQGNAQYGDGIFPFHRSQTVGRQEIHLGNAQFAEGPSDGRRAGHFFPIHAPGGLDIGSADQFRPEEDRAVHSHGERGLCDRKVEFGGCGLFLLHGFGGAGGQEGRHCAERYQNAVSHHYLKNSMLSI